MIIELPEWIKEWEFRKARYKIAYGGRGSAKSWSIARLLLLKAYREKKRVLCTREFQSSIADSVHLLLSEQIEMMELSGFSVKRTEITHENGSSIYFKGLAINPHNLKGNEGVDLVWAEEAEKISDTSWKKLIPTIRKEDSEIWISFNPEFVTDPTFIRFYGGNAPKGAIVCEVNHDKNPWFPKVLREEMDRDYERDPDYANHVWAGKPITYSEAQVLTGKWIVKEFTPELFWDGPYYGVDWGFSTDPLCGVKVWVYADSLYIEEEVYGYGVDIPYNLLCKLPGIRTHVVRADNAWPETIESTRRAGIPKIIPVDKFPGSVNEGIRWLRGRKQIVIHPRCGNTHREAQLWRYKTDKANNVLPVLLPGNEHTWDAIRYAVAPLIRTRKMEISIA